MDTDTLQWIWIIALAVWIVLHLLSHHTGRWKNR